MTDKSKKSVWLIDDDIIHNMALEILLNQSKLVEQVKCFTKALNAIHELNKLSNSDSKLPDVIFLDINMHDMDGWEFLDELKVQQLSLELKSKLFMLTSSVNKTDKEKASNRDDINGFISKPLTIPALTQLFGN